MIVDSVKNLNRYVDLGKNFKTAIDFISQLDLATVTPQDFAIDGKNVYGFTKYFDLAPQEDRLFEAHERYIDIQLLISGRESIYVAETDSLPPHQAYDAERDIAFYKDGYEQNLVELTPMTFGIFYPWDAHKPCCISRSTTQSYKLVVKVLL